MSDTTVTTRPSSMGRTAVKRIAMTGASGLVGSALISALEPVGSEIIRLVRRQRLDSMLELYWDPHEGFITPERLNGVEAMVHLAGESITGRWTSAKKLRIHRSRVEGTRTLCQALAKLEAPPRVLVCASAIGFYGDRGDETLDESSPAGTGFLAGVCQEWEAATEAAASAGIRVVHLRLGMVVSRRGGALKAMLLPFKMGVGGRVGSGKQYWSWIHLDDVVGAIHHAMTREELSGPVNAVSPRPATNAEFTAILGRVLRRPTLFPMPAFAARMALGEMADELLLTSARVLPRKLQRSAYAFRQPELEDALKYELGR